MKKKCKFDVPTACFGLAGPPSGTACAAVIKVTELLYTLRTAVSLVQLPMMSLEFFVEYQDWVLVGKGGWCLRLTAAVSSAISQHSSTLTHCNTAIIFQPTSAQIYITALCVYIMFTATCFDISLSSSGSFKNLCLAKLHKLHICATACCNKSNTNMHCTYINTL